jgi:DNA-binding NtrC family response regulator
MSQPSESKPVLAVINTSEEICRLLYRAFTRKGFEVPITYVPDLKRGEPDIQTFLREHDPKVVLWDVAIPYQEYWQFLQSVTHSESAADRAFVLTTTNKGALDSLVGPTDTYEIIDRPFDLDIIVDAVRRALKHQQAHSTK